MALLGTISLVKDHKLDRSRMMLATTLVSVGLIAFGGLDKLVILIPTIYILASLGIAHMINSWLDVFPRNPLARNVGVGIICTVVAFTSFYHLNRYFVAWPNTPETIHALHVARLK